MNDEITIRAVVVANQGKKLLVDDGKTRFWVQGDEIRVITHSEQDGLITFAISRELAEKKGLV